MARLALVLAGVAGIFAVAACNSADQAGDTGNGSVVNSAEASTASNAADSIRARQTHYKQIARGMKAIGDQLKAGSPDVAVVQQESGRIADLAPQVLGWFPDGSGSAAGLNSRAKQEIWSDPEGFRRAAQGFIDESRRFHEIAQGGDVAAIRAALPALGNSCKSCHDRFRAPEE